MYIIYFKYIKSIFNHCNVDILSNSSKLGLYMMTYNATFVRVFGNMANIMHYPFWVVCGPRGGG